MCALAACTPAMHLSNMSFSATALQVELVRTALAASIERLGLGARMADD